jgi:hypothetical protein
LRDHDVPSSRESPDLGVVVDDDDDAIVVALASSPQTTSRML